MYSTTLYNLCTAGYVTSLAIFAVHLVNTRNRWLRLGVLLVAFSLLMQTGGMLLRWIEAGYLEVSAAEQAVGQKLVGWSWFVVFTQHPPWSNLYEIMVYMSWGVIIVTLMAELKWQMAWIRQLGIMLALLALGMASLTDASIRPLVPALKSWWIMIHVISACIAYAAGALAAFTCLFALMADKTRVPRYKFAGFALIAFGALLLAIGGGARLINEQTYFVKLLAMAGEGIVSVMDMSKNQGIAFLVPMPYVSWPLIGAVFFHLLAGLSILVFGLNKYITRIYAVGLSLTFVILGLIIFNDIRQAPLVLNTNLANHLVPAGPWFVSFKSHQWSFGLLLLVVVAELLIFLFLTRPDALRTRLPSVEVLENCSYKAISLSFFLMTLMLITGALWAHYAWGRYWAWDPKETGSLAIWLSYAIYLHTRRTAGLSGPFSSVLGVLGFFIIIIGFLGVNLGLFAEGLHTYGNS
jgi:ABC-type transport system involved in cytochrome c biogenesis permease subunit